MIEQLVMMSMQLSSELLARQNLNEFEHEMYENICRMVTSHCKSVRLMNELNNIDLEKDLTARQDCEETNQE